MVTHLPFSASTCVHDSFKSTAICTPRPTPSSILPCNNSSLQPVPKRFDKQSTGCNKQGLKYQLFASASWPNASLRSRDWLFPTRRGWPSPLPGGWFSWAAGMLDELGVIWDEGKTSRSTCRTQRLGITRSEFYISTMKAIVNHHPAMSPSNRHFKRPVRGFS